MRKDGALEDLVRTVKKNKSYYLLEDSAERVYYILCEEIQVVSIHVLDDRVDEIKDW